jgi:hypothetical protein
MMPVEFQTVVVDIEREGVLQVGLVHETEFIKFVFHNDEMIDNRFGGHRP